MAGDDRTAVTIIGLGAMGSALAEAFLKGGHPTTVWNRSADKADDLVAKGALRASTVTDAFAASPLVVLCVLDYVAVHEILDPLGDAVSGRVLVNLTTGTPDQARETAGWAAQRGVEYLDGGILADPEQIGTPGARLFFSGSQGAFETHAATLKVLGEAATYYGSDAGLASVYFMALIGLSYEIWIAYLNTLALVDAENVDAMTFAPSATEVLTPTIELLTEFARAADDGNYPPVAGPLSAHAALMDDLIDTWQARHVDVERLKHVEALIDQSVGEGHGTEGFSGLIEPIKRQRDKSTVKVVDADHTNWWVKDLERSLGFYRDLLGLEPFGLDEYRRGERSLVSLRVTPTFILHLRPDPSFQPVSTGGYDHLALVVEGTSSDALAERLADEGVEVEHRSDNVVGARGIGEALYVRDPDGYLIELKLYDAGPGSSRARGGTA